MIPFATRLLAWFDRHGRHDLPWQHPRSAYRVWLSEVMLQQTQVRTVIGYFDRFVDALPDIAALAEASEDRVLALWSGLGYYSRARNLHAAAKQVMVEHAGELPRDVEALAGLPGIGRSTAAAIVAQVHGDRHAILDGNVKRVLARHHGIDGWPGSSAVARRLWDAAQALTPDDRVADYTQAIMDLGATICRRSRPSCDRCPVAADCVALREGRVDELPTRKPARELPSRDTAMLLLRDGQGRVALWRRPPTGIWGGLWSLPERDGADAARRLAASLSDSGARELATIVHGFTHFRLAITPWLVQINRLPTQVAEADCWQWYGVAQWRGLGLPTPVRRLLESLESGVFDGT